MQPEEPALTRLRVVRWMQLLTPLMLTWFVWAAVTAEPGFGLTGKRLIVVLATAVFVAGVFGRNATAKLPIRPVHVVFVAAMLVSSVTLVAVQPSGPCSVAVLVAVLCAATALMPVRVAVPVLIAAFVVLEMVASITGQDFGFLAVLAGFAVLFASMYLAFRLAEAQRETKRLLAELEAGQAALAEAAGLAERQRLAREMHDVLAHSLSGLSLQLEGARMLVTEDPTDPRLPAVVDRAHHLARTGLQEARRATTRDDELTWNGSQRLVGDLGKAVGELKERPGRELQVHGSGALAQSLMQEGLIDTYRLLIFPVVLGRGRRLFGDGLPPAGLRLVDHQVSGSGVTMLTYDNTGAPAFGSMVK